MHRFWLFPVLLGLVGIFLPPLILCEGFVPLLVANINWGIIADLAFALGRITWLDFVGFMGETAPYSGSAGFVVGVSVAVFDWWRNGRRDRMGIYATAALLPNIGWCLVYAGCLSLLNGLVFYGILLLIRIFYPWSILWSLPLDELTFALIALLNVCAVLWGSVRSVTSEDVLTPPLLRAKLKRSSRLTG